MMDVASTDGVEARLMEELDRLLREQFPRTTRFVESKRDSDIIERPEDFFEQVSTFAWVEAHSVLDEEGNAVVEGVWSQEDIAEDIRECFREAQNRIVGGEG